DRLVHSPTAEFCGVHWSQFNPANPRFTFESKKELALLGHCPRRKRKPAKRALIRVCDFIVHACFDPVLADRELNSRHFPFRQGLAGSGRFAGTDNHAIDHLKPTQLTSIRWCSVKHRETLRFGCNQPTTNSSPVSRSTSTFSR